MAIVSTFELLTKPLIPAALDQVGSGRIIVQGYFLTIANLGNTDLRLRLRFTATTPGFNIANLAAFYDVTGSESFPVPAVSGSSITYLISVPARDTGLFILQPNVANRQILISANTELRGFVEIFLANPFGTSTFNLLLTPEHRGTFLPRDIVIPPTGPVTSVTRDFDQLAYALPTAEGKAQYTLTQRRLTASDTLTAPSLGDGAAIEENFSLIWERLEELSQVQPVNAS